MEEAIYSKIHERRLQMNNLKDRNWIEKSITEIFPEISRGKRLKKGDHIVGLTPYVSSTAANNGVDNFIGNGNKVRVFEDCLTIANSGSVGSTFYHPYQFVASDHVTELKRPGLDKYAYLFLATLVERVCEKYSFNREINDDRLKREKIVVPVLANGDIDFEFMSSFMRAKEIKLLKPIIDKLCKRLILNELMGVIHYILIGKLIAFRKYLPYYRESA